MRILYLSGETIPSVSASSSHILTVSRYLQSFGHDVTLAANKGPGQKTKDIVDGIPIIRTTVQFFGTLPLLHAFNPLLHKKYDLILERFSAIGGCGVVLSKLKNIPLVLEMNGPHVDEAIQNGQLSNPLLIHIARRIELLQYEHASAIIAPITEIVSVEYRSKVRTIAWGTDPDLFKKRAPPKNLQKKLAVIKKRIGKRFCIIFHGSFRPWHGAEVLIDIAKDFKKKPIVFLLVGKYPKHLSEEVTSQQLSNVIFVDEVPYQHMPYYIDLADAGVTPFNTTKYPLLKTLGFWWLPLKLLEYMSMKKVVILPAHPLLKKYVPKNNMFYSPDKKDSLASAIWESSKTTNLQRAHIGTTNRRRIESLLNWEMHARSLEKLFLKLTR